MTEITVTSGITELKSDKPGRWSASPQDAGKLDLHTVNDTTAHLAVLVNGIYFIAFATADSIEWTKVAKDGPTPTPGTDWLAKLNGAASWVWGKVKAAATSKASGYVLVAALTAVAFAGSSQFQGCTIPWPTPTPPGPAPVPSDSFKVAFIVETADTLTKEQTSAIYGAATRDYLNAKAKDWKVFDKDDKPSDPFWQSVLARPRTKTPWVFATNGKQTLEQPLPDSGVVDLLKKYGG